MLPLYRLTEQYLELSALWEAGEIDDQAFADTVQGIDENFETKARNIVGLVVSLTREAEAYKAESDRLDAAKKSRLRLADKLQDYLLRNMIATGRNNLKFEGMPGVSVHTGRGRVEVSDIRLLPKLFIRTKEEADKAKIQDALKAGEDVPGVKLVQEQNLRIGV